jgi:zinc/manganese transport system substrate-binding protein
MRIGRRAGALCGAALALASCSTGATPPASGSKLSVVVAENFWGSIVTQLAGARANVTSIVVNPATDPHDYEATAADGRAIALANYVVYNGLGYDEWVNRSLDASPSKTRAALNVGALLGLRVGDNPHQWYSPTSVDRFIARVTADLQKLDPEHKSYYAARRDAYETTGLRDYRQLITTIRDRYSQVAVGASESIFAPLASALNLNLVTPPAFVDAIAEGNEPSARDKAAVDAQINDRSIKVFVFNTQNVTPDVQRLVDACRSRGIPVATVTESLTPASLTFQEWQARQLRALEAALAATAGR